MRFIKKKIVLILTASLISTTLLEASSVAYAAQVPNEGSSAADSTSITDDGGNTGDNAKESENTGETKEPDGTQDTDETKEPDGTQDTDETKEPDGTQDTDETKEPDGTQETDGTKEPDGTQDTDETKEPDGTQDTDGTKEPDGTQDTDETKEPDGTQDTNGTQESDGTNNTDEKKDTNGTQDTDGTKDTDVTKDKDKDDKDEKKDKDKEKTKEKGLSKAAYGAASDYGISADRIFSVASYGANGSDNRDDYSAFNQALEEANKAAASSAAMVYVPNGTYYISDSLKISSNVYFVCESSNAVIKKTGDGVRYMLTCVNTGAGNYDNFSNIIIDGGTWDAGYYVYDALAGEGGSHMYFYHGSNLRIKNVSFKNNRGAHMIELGGVKDAEITQCTFDGFKYDNENNKKEAIQLDIVNNSVVMPGLQGNQYDDATCQNINITGNAFKNYSRAIGTHTAVKKVYNNNINISSNNFENLNDEAVYLYNFINSSVSNNTFNNVRQAVAIRSFSDNSPLENNLGNGSYITNLSNNNFNNKITNNNIATTDADSDDSGAYRGIVIIGSNEYKLAGTVINGNTIKSKGTAIYLTYADNNSVKSNNLYRINSHNKGEGVDGIDLSDASCNSVVEGNNIYNNGGIIFEQGIGASDSSTGNQIKGNVVDKTIYQGIQTRCDNTTISNNTVKNCDGDGIKAWENAKSVAIRDNNIINSTKYGININTGANAEINGNKITGSGSHGVRVEASGTQAKLENNTITGNGGYGIHAITTGGTVTLNKVSNNILNDNEDGGIYVEKGKAPDLSSNTINNCNYGIFIVRSSASINKNTISGSRGIAGIMARDEADITVSNNKITDSKGQGVRIEGNKTKAKVNNNTISNNKKYGIFVKTSSGTTTVSELKSNTIKGNSDGGIYLEKVKASNISKNTIEKGSNGLYAKNSTITFKDNKISNTSKFGVYSKDTGSNITGNTVKNCKESGIRLEGKSSSTVSSNTVTGNKAYGIFVKGSSKSNTKIKAIDSNTVKSNSKGGVYVENATVTSLKKNTVTGNSKYGLYVKKATAKSIKSNKLSNPNAKYEIYLSGSSTNVAKTKVIKINKLTKNSKKITGTALAKRTITTKVGKKKYSAKVTSKGKFTIKIPKQKKGTKITLSFKDKGSNTISNSIVVK